MRFVALLAFSPLLLANPALDTKPAKELTYQAAPGAFYQLQAKRDGQWRDDGHAVKGAGQLVTVLRPEGECRVVALKNQWALVWSDEFDGDDLDYSKWAKEAQIINLAVDGRFFEQTSQKADNLPAGAFPQLFQLDYVRVYQQAE